MFPEVSVIDSPITLNDWRQKENVAVIDIRLDRHLFYTTAMPPPGDSRGNHLAIQPAWVRS